METLMQRFFKHSLKCSQCSEHPDKPCPIGEIILSAAASVFILSAKKEGA